MAVPVVAGVPRLSVPTAGVFLSVFVEVPAVVGVPRLELSVATPGCVLLSPLDPEVADASLRLLP